MVQVIWFSSQEGLESNHECKQIFYGWELHSIWVLLRRKLISKDKFEEAPICNFWYDEKQVIKEKFKKNIKCSIFSTKKNVCFKQDFMSKNFKLKFSMYQNLLDIAH